ncbi:MAG: DNA mismatch repair endonuclease MutL [Anaerolineae bacterium]
MPIRVLSEEVRAKIAAGEVVERPASVVKELIENSIDAGATEIKVEVRQGGRRLVRVIDNGCGIPTDEVELAFARHATSKLATAEDLTHITTLGFRGEALPSIAAVSRVTMVTRAVGEEMGTLLRLEKGQVVHREGKGVPQGTVVTVENLFYNVPARLKFLRTVATEARHISDLVTRYALAYPELRFSLLSEGRMAFQTTGSGELLDVLIKVYGLEVARQMLEVGKELTDPSVPSVYGYISPPPLHRSNRKHLTFFINRRWVQDRTLSYAVTEAYHTLLPTGRYPLVVLNVQLDPAAVDVNVHPAKAEVRFRDSQVVFAAVQRAVRATLRDQAPIPSIVPRPHAAPVPEWGRRKHLARVGRLTRGQLGLEVQRTADVEGAVALEPSTPAKLPMLRVLGQLRQTYIIAEGPEGMYLIDQHAAHERVLYERLRAERASMKVISQSLLEPVTLELTSAQAAVLQEHLSVLTELGFTIEPFGGRTYLVRAVPAILKETEPRRALAGIIDELVEGGIPLGREGEARLMASVCKQGAVKAGQTLSQEEMQELIRQLERTASPRTCPHGRPTMIHLSAAQLEREFGRR